MLLLDVVALRLFLARDDPFLFFPELVDLRDVLLVVESLRSPRKLEVFSGRNMVKGRGIGGEVAWPLGGRKLVRVHRAILVPAHNLQRAVAPPGYCSPES